MLETNPLRHRTLVFLPLSEGSAVAEEQTRSLRESGEGSLEEIEKVS
jgi:hypothetical protein